MKAVGHATCGACGTGHLKGYKPRGWKPGDPLAVWQHNCSPGLRDRGPVRCGGSYKPGLHSVLYGAAPPPPAPRRIFNTHEQLVAAGGGVAITVHDSGTRESYVAGWAIHRVVNGRSVVTDKDAPWYNYGAKVFLLPMRYDREHQLGRTFAERKMIALRQAQDWVAAQGWYDGAWARNAAGDFVPTAVQERFPIKREKRNKVQA